MSESAEKPQLWLAIDRKWYRVEKVHLDRPLKDQVAWRLHPRVETTESDSPYMVLCTGKHATCECADFTMQREKRGEVCKHIVACGKAGLI